MQVTKESFTIQPMSHALLLVNVKRFGETKHVFQFFLNNLKRKYPVCL